MFNVKNSKPTKVGMLNTLFLNATTPESMTVISQLDEQGHKSEVANSFQAAIRALEDHVPDLVVIDASLEFSSTDALMYIRNMFDGKIAAYGDEISAATRQLLIHLGISVIVVSISDIASQLFSDSPDLDLASAV